MKIDMSIDSNTFWLGTWVCAAVVTVTITAAVWSFCITEVKHYTKNGYEQISDKGTVKTYWRKAKIKN